MNAIDILKDLADRPAQAAERLRDRLTPEALAAHPGGHANSPAWLLWHIGREIDVQVAQMGGGEQVWHSGGYAERTGLGDRGEAIGYGQSDEEARAVRTADAGPLLDYVRAATDALTAYLDSLADADLDEVVDEEWDPPVTRGVRLVSIIDDAAQHAGQLAYAIGAPERG